MRPLRGGLRFAASLGAICGIAALSLLLIEAQTAPWARSFTGASTLTGQWVGEMTTPTGARQLVWLNIGHETGTCIGCPSLGGDAHTCDANAQAHRYEIWGDVDNPRATAFHLKTRESEASDIHLGYLDGKWSGDVITLTTTLVAPNNPPTMHWERSDTGVETTTMTGGHPDARAPITFKLHRGALRDFEARCRAGKS